MDKKDLKDKFKSMVYSSLSKNYSTNKVVKDAIDSLDKNHPIHELVKAEENMTPVPAADQGNVQIPVDDDSVLHKSTRPLSGFMAARHEKGVHKDLGPEYGLAGRSKAGEHARGAVQAKKTNYLNGAAENFNNESAKQEHKKVLSDIKSMPKPSLGKATDIVGAQLTPPNTPTPQKGSSVTSGDLFARKPEKKISPALETKPNMGTSSPELEKGLGSAAKKVGNKLKNPMVGAAALMGAANYGTIPALVGAGNADRGQSFVQGAKEGAKMQGKGGMIGAVINGPKDVKKSSLNKAKVDNGKTPEQKKLSREQRNSYMNKKGMKHIAEKGVHKPLSQTSGNSLAGHYARSANAVKPYKDHEGKQAVSPRKKEDVKFARMQHEDVKHEQKKMGKPQLEKSFQEGPTWGAAATKGVAGLTALAAVANAAGHVGHGPQKQFHNEYGNAPKTQVQQSTAKPMGIKGHNVSFGNVKKSAGSAIAQNKLNLKPQLEKSFQEGPTWGAAATKGVAGLTALAAVANAAGHVGHGPQKQFHNEYGNAPKTQVQQSTAKPMGIKGHNVSFGNVKKSAGSAIAQNKLNLKPESKARPLAVFVQRKFGKAEQPSESPLVSQNWDKSKVQPAPALTKDDMGGDMMMSEKQIKKASPDMMAAKQVAQPKAPSMGGGAPTQAQPQKMIPKTPSIPQAKVSAQGTGAAKPPMPAKPAIPNKPLGASMGNKGAK